MKLEFHYLCSQPNITENKMKKIVDIVSEDSIGLVNTVDDDGFSPLLLIARNNQSGNLIRCIKYLLTALLRKNSNEEFLKVDVNYQDRNGYNVLHYICKNYQDDDFLETFELLIECGIDLNKSEKGLGNNALQLLFRDNERGEGVLEIVQAFINNGIDLKHRNSDGFTALHYLCQCYAHENLLEVAKLLIENGVDVNAKDYSAFRLNAFHYLCHYYPHDNLIKVVQLFINNGLHLAGKVGLSEGWTSLLLLCRCYKKDNLDEIAKLLKYNCIDVTAKLSDGRNASAGSL